MYQEEEARLLRWSAVLYKEFRLAVVVGDEGKLTGCRRIVFAHCLAVWRRAGLLYG